MLFRALIVSLGAWELGLPVGKVNSVIESLVLLAFSTDRNDAFLPFHILQLEKSLPVFIP